MKKPIKKLKGITSEKIFKIIPNASLTAIDFSEVMLSGARKRLSKYKTKFIVGDYAKENFGKNFKIIISVIGIHHQNNEGKRKLFKKIFNSLKKAGIFIALPPYLNQLTASLNRGDVFWPPPQSDHPGLKDSLRNADRNP